MASQEYRAPMMDSEPKDLENASDKATDSLDHHGSTDEEKIEHDHPEEAAAEAEAQPKGPPAGGPPGGPPPNGGLQAWLQVVGSWCLFFNTWGLLNTFGVFSRPCTQGMHMTDLFSRCIPNILRIWRHLHCDFIGYIMDWIRASIGASAHGRFRRPSV